MKTYIKIVTTLYVILMCSCSSSDVELYKEASGIYFNGVSSSYSFVENLSHKELGSDTINIPVMITGFSRDYDREVLIKEDQMDTLNTVSSGMFEILGGIVPKGEVLGTVRLKINYTQALDDSVYVLRLKMYSTNDFPVIDLNQYNYSVNITAQFAEPANWVRLKRTFGNYSNSWYAFILKETGLSSIPYWSYNGSADKNNPDPERWTMTYSTLQAYAALVKEALTNYNNAHPGAPLKHEDGEFKDQIITM